MCAASQLNLGSGRLDNITLLLYNITIMTWEVEFTDQFHEWWSDLAAEEQEAITAAVMFLEERGPHLADRSSRRSSNHATPT